MDQTQKPTETKSAFDDIGNLLFPKYNVWDRSNWSICMWEDWNERLEFDFVARRQEKEYQRQLVSKK